MVNRGQPVGRGLTYYILYTISFMSQQKGLEERSETKIYIYIQNCYTVYTVYIYARFDILVVPTGTAGTFIDLILVRPDLHPDTHW